MRLLSHFALVGFSNTYLLGPEGGGEALLIDPGRMDLKLLDLIEDNGFVVRDVLITHGHENHTRGLLTLSRIYETTIYYAGDRLLGRTTIHLSGDEEHRIGLFEVRCLRIRGHSTDSLVYLIGDLCFTGDILSAGRIGTTGSGFARENLLSDIRDKLLILPDDTIILPGHGPPTTVGLEKTTNPALNPLNGFLP